MLPEETGKGVGKRDREGEEGKQRGDFRQSPNFGLIEQGSSRVYGTPQSLSGPKARELGFSLHLPVIG